MSKNTPSAPTPLQARLNVVARILHDARKEVAAIDDRTSAAEAERRRRFLADCREVEAELVTQLGSVGQRTPV